MHHNNLSYSTVTHKPYQHLVTVSGSVTSLTWDPRTMGSHLCVRPSADTIRFAQVNVTLSGTYTPQVGDTLTLTVIGSSAVAVQQPVFVKFLGQTYFAENTPLTFAYQGNLYPGLDWVQVTRPATCLRGFWADGFQNIQMVSTDVGLLSSKQNYSSRHRGFNIAGYSEYATGNVTITFSEDNLLDFSDYVNPDYNFLSAIKKPRMVAISDNRQYITVLGDKFAPSTVICSRFNISTRVVTNVTTGSSWTTLTADPYYNDNGLILVSLLVNDYSVLQFSNNDGSSWSTVYTGPAGDSTALVNGVCISGSYMFRGTANGDVYRAPLGSSSWTLVMSSGGSAVLALTDNHKSSSTGSGVVATMGDGNVYVSNNNGDSGSWVLGDNLLYPIQKIVSTYDLLVGISGDPSTGPCRLVWTDSCDGTNFKMGRQLVAYPRLRAGGTIPMILADKTTGTISIGVNPSNWDTTNESLRFNFIETRRTVSRL